MTYSNDVYVDQICYTEDLEYYKYLEAFYVKQSLRIIQFCDCESFLGNQLTSDQ